MTHASVRLLISQLIGQLKNRKVARVTVVYVIVGWIVLQVGDVTFEALALPPWSQTLLIVIMLLGFPIAVVLAWAYEITPQGVVRDVGGRVSGARSNSTAYAKEGCGTPVGVEAPSIAVFPFEDMSAGGNMEYFCEGLAEEIITALCHTQGVRVVARMGSFEFGSKSANIAEVGRSLGVSAFLEGSVRKDGERLRIAAQLFDIANGDHIWSGLFDRKMEHIFEIQEDIAREVVTSLQAVLHVTEYGLERGCDNPRAYEYFLRGLGYFTNMSETNLQIARQMFNKAIDIDPECGRAWALLACSHACSYLHFQPLESHREKALKFSVKALELAPELSHSHIAHGIAKTLLEDYVVADKEFQRAIELNPGSFEAWFLYARSKAQQGEPENAAGFFERASILKPDDFQSPILRASQLDKLGDRKASLDALREGLKRARLSVDFNPDNSRAWNLGAFALMRLGEHEEAERWMNKSLQTAPRRSAATYNAACFYTHLGELEKALDFLEQSIHIGIISPQWMKYDEDLAPLRNHPRFESTMAKLASGQSERPNKNLSL